MTTRMVKTGTGRVALLVFPQEEDIARKEIQKR